MNTAVRNELKFMQCSFYCFDVNETKNMCHAYGVFRNLNFFNSALNILLIKLCYFNAHLLYSSVNDEMLPFPPSFTFAFSFIIIFFFLH
jgi:hypothetical protein